MSYHTMSYFLMISIKKSLSGSIDKILFGVSVISRIKQSGDKLNHIYFQNTFDSSFIFIR